MDRDSVMRQTVDHARRVGNLMLEVISDLQNRAVNHDQTKFSEEEYSLFAQETPNLRSLTYGSKEYTEALARLGPALEHHYQNNRHHPEHWESGISGMSLIDLIEMLSDWKAATERHADGSLSKSIEHNSERFGYGEEIKNLLRRTAEDLEWL